MESHGCYYTNYRDRGMMGRAATGPEHPGVSPSHRGKMCPWARKTHRGELAARTHRTESFRAGDAVAAYLERELEIIAGIECGAADVRAHQVLARRTSGGTLTRESKNPEPGDGNGEACRPVSD
jgi:predicted transcriptional regulator